MPPCALARLLETLGWRAGPLLAYEVRYYLGSMYQ
jgi:hypothetical protein